MVTKELSGRLVRRGHLSLGRRREAELQNSVNRMRIDRSYLVVTTQDKRPGSQDVIEHTMQMHVHAL